MPQLYGHHRYRPESRHNYRRYDGRRVAAVSECFYDGSHSYGIRGSWINGPDSPTPSLAVLSNLQDEGASPRSPSPRMDLAEAFGLAHEALEATKVTTVPCLGKNSRSVHYSAHDLPFMTFGDLDKKLFRSVLYGNVYLTWARLPHGIFGRTSRVGLHGRRRITIELSLHVADDRTATLGVLLHQMIHAYYLQCCGHKNKRAIRKGHDLRHREEFKGLRRTIKEHFLPGERDVWDAANDLNQMFGTAGRYHRPEAGCSDCHCRSSKAKSGEIERWTMAAIARVKADAAKRAASNRCGGGSSAENSDSRAESPATGKYYSIERDGSSIKYTAHSRCPFPQGTYITVQEGVRLYPIGKQNLHHVEELRKSTFFRDDILFLPNSSSREGLESLLSYLKEGDFAPSRDSALQAAQNALPYGSSFHIINAKGPPVILPTITDSPRYLAASITAYRLAKTLQFEPLATVAINRVYDLPCTSEDPIALLGQVYKPEPALAKEDNLRAWVRRWLSRKVDPSFPLQYQAKYPTNMHFLQRHPELGEQFENLLWTHEALAQDVLTAGDTLVDSAAMPLARQDFLRHPKPATSPFVNPAPLSNLSLLNQYPLLLDPHRWDGNLYRNEQQREAARAQLALNAEREKLLETPMGHEIYDALRQYQDPRIERLVRERGLPFP